MSPELLRTLGYLRFGRGRAHWAIAGAPEQAVGCWFARRPEPGSDPAPPPAGTSGARESTRSACMRGGRSDDSRHPPSHLWIRQCRILCGNLAAVWPSVGNGGVVLVARSFRCPGWHVGRVPELRARGELGNRSKQQPRRTPGGELLVVMTCVLDHLEHVIADAMLEFGVGSGSYPAMCGQVVVPSSLASRPGEPCSECLSRLPSTLSGRRVRARGEVSARQGVLRRMFH